MKDSDLTDALVTGFPKWVSYFESNPPFRKPVQLEYHLETIHRRREIGSAAGAVSDDRFRRSLYRTLRAWGIGSRGSRLKPFEEFAAVPERQTDAMLQFEDLVLDGPSLDARGTGEALWALMSRFTIVNNASQLVPMTKALHHILPELVVPMDREYTQTFFGWQNPQFQYGQRECFMHAFEKFVEIARAVNPAQYVGDGWNSSRTKVIDNALAGVVRWAADKVSRGTGSTKA
jgi:hypothetical protein